MISRNVLVMHSMDELLEDLIQTSIDYGVARSNKTRLGIGRKMDEIKAEIIRRIQENEG